MKKESALTQDLSAAKKKAKKGKEGKARPRRPA